MKNHVTGIRNKGSLGITSLILFISFCLIAMTAASVILKPSSSNNALSVQNVNDQVNEAVNEISTYIQEKDMVGKYTTIGNEKKITQIALLLKPLFTIDIDLSALTIKLYNGENIRLLTYNQHAASLGAQSLFDHSVWKNNSNNTFSIIVVQDSDSSLKNFGLMNQNTDMIYLLISLPDDFAMKYGDNLFVTLFPTPGVSRTFELTASLPMHSIVSFE
jgi:archaellin